MPRKKAAAKTAKTTKSATAKRGRPKKVAAPQKQSTFASVAEYLKLGESYTSLVLGIIAVIIGTVLLLSVVHNRQGTRITPEVTPTIAQSQSFAISPTGIAIKQPTMTQGLEKPTEVTPTPKAEEENKAQPQQVAGGTTYTVAAGDNLWIIAEKAYKDGYKWVEIAKANNLTDPNDIHVGNKLVIPGVTKDIPTVQTADEHLSTSTQSKIVENTYKVQPGDSLWGIALRAYGDGYRWVEIAKVNNLTDPNVIHVNNVLKIPRQ